MASSVPVVGETFTFGCSAISQADTDIFQAAATIAAGDFQRSINGGAFANLDNTPTVTPAAGKRIQFIISAAETTSAGAGGEIYIVGSDQAGDEWQDFAVTLRVFATNLDNLPDAVWDELIAGHLGAGSTGASLNAAGAAGDPWLTALPGAYVPGSAGYIIGNCAVNIVNYISSHISAIGNLLRKRSPDLGCLYRGDTWTETIGGLGDLSTATNIWVAVKEKSKDPDSAALLLISMDVGLEVINQAPAGALLAAHGSVGVVAPATGGFIDFYVHQDETAKLEPDKYYFDIQVETPYGAGSRIDTRRAGYVVIEGDIVRATA